MVVVGTTDVAGATSTGAALLCCLDHCANNLGMLAHTEVVVRAPPSHVHLLTGVGVAAGSYRELASFALQVGKDTVTTLALDLVYFTREDRLVAFLGAHRRLGNTVLLKSFTELIELSVLLARAAITESFGLVNAFRNDLRHVRAERCGVLHDSLVLDRLCADCARFDKGALEHLARHRSATLSHFPRPFRFCLVLPTRMM
mmetsp:Transcript_22507/g.39891  ORF Transcript_22507/g.39891 Transcript_22507/m.39891 type:complete len:201 (+) Transcript_22507:87-689(+)